MTSMKQVEVDIELIRRFRANDADRPLTEEELERLHDFYYEIERRINLLGPDFYLAKKELDRMLLRVRWLKDSLKK